MKYEVSVEKRMYSTGLVTVYCESPEQAIQMVQNQIECGGLQSTAVEWSEPTYEDLSFTTTGDVDAQQELPRE